MHAILVLRRDSRRDCPSFGDWQSKNEKRSAQTTVCPARSRGQMDHAREFTRLYNLDYGEPNELIFRFASIATGGVILYSYTGWSISILWLIGYFALHSYYHYYLTRNRDVTTAQHTVHASIVFLALHAFFIVLPTYLMLQPDIAMNFCGTSAVACLLVWLIRRADVLPAIVVGNIVIIAVSVACMLVVTLPRVDFFLAKIAMVLCSIGAVAYYAGAVLISRRQRLQAEESAYRSIEAQKMAVSYTHLTLPTKA